MRAVATAVEIDQAISDFIQRLQKGICVEAIVLFGSYAKGTPHEWSDVDVAVISPDFEGMPISRRQEIIAQLSLHSYPRLAPLGFSSSEYHNPRSASFLTEIIRNGKVAYRAS
ncbi:MAG: nucleotidyltransferase domain-containing protein [Chloroflexi bacterium]|nr:nucleotidyltransferase domain-containing protein [Chloroflexota bacterium]